MVLLVALALPLALGDAASAAPGGVTLEDALAALFARGPRFEALAAPARAARGARVTASGAFDVVANAGVVGQRTLWNAPFGAMTNDGFADVAVQGALSTRTRDNVSVQIGGSTPLVSSVDPRISPDQPQVTGAITIPLLKFGGSAGLAAAERAAQQHEAATAALQLEQEAALAADIAAAYWRWVGSHTQLKVVQKLEALAADQLSDVDALIAQHARAPVDRLAFAAAVENARASREQAAQELFEQGRAMWEAIGVPPPDATTFPAADLPAVPAGVDADSLSRLALQASGTRPLRAAYRDEVAAAQTQVRAAQIGLRPDLNILAQATVTRVDDATVATQTQLGYYGLVGLQISLPIQNRAAEGSLMAATAVEEAATLEASAGQNAIAVRIEALSGRAATLARTYEERVRAAEQLQQEYEADRVRFRMGNATSMDVVVAEQQWTSASLAVVADQTSYAVTTTHLMQEAGVLTSAVRARDAAGTAHRLVDSSFGGPPR